MQKSGEENKGDLMRVEYREGPLPDASELHKYEEVQKGFAERIMRMAEKEQDHRHKMDLYPIQRSQLTKNIGQFLGFILAMSLIVAGTFLIQNDKDAQGLTSIFLGIGSVAGAFIYDRRSRDSKK